MTEEKAVKKYKKNFPKQQWIADHRPLRERYANAQEFYNHIQRYMQKCVKEKRPQTLSGLCAFIHCGRGTFRRLGSKKEPEWQEWAAVSRQVMLELMSFAEGESFTAEHNVKGNPAGAIFNLKTNYGFVEAGQHQHTSPITINLTAGDQGLIQRPPVDEGSVVIADKDELLTEGE